MDDGNLFDHRFRPLLSAAVGSGLVALAMMDFAGSAWGDIDIRARMLVADAMRASMCTFLFTLLLLMTSYALDQRMGSGRRTALNLAGTAMFLVGTVVSGRALSTALSIETGPNEPPPEILGFFGTSLFVSVVLLGLLAVSAFRKPRG